MLSLKEKLSLNIFPDNKDSQHIPPRLHFVFNRNMLSKGSSEPWPEALQAIAGTDVISAKSILKYFEPLIRYLETENANNGDILGWPDAPEYGILTSSFENEMLVVIHDITTRYN